MINRRKLFALAAATGASLALAGAAFAKDAVYSKRGVAADGYDTVAFFTNGAPTKGSDDFTTNYNGVEWHFSSQANLDRFQANPSAYAPQYGGYCAWAVANGSTARGNPKFWKIVDGKLYLNYNGGIQKKWLKDVPGFIAKGDANWPGVLN